MNAKKSGPTLRAYRVRPDWVADCPKCGAPFYCGDVAWEVWDRGTTIEAGFCSKRCALAYLETWETMADDYSEAEAIP